VEQIIPGIRDLATTLRAALRGYSGHQLEVVGQVTVQVVYEQQKLMVPLVDIAGIQKPVLFGRNWMASVELKWNELHQVQPDSLQQILDKHSDLFEKAVGTIQGYTTDVRLKPEAKPIFKKNQSVPYALQNALDYEL